MVGPGPTLTLDKILLYSSQNGSAEKSSGLRLIHDLSRHCQCPRRNPNGISKVGIIESVQFVDNIYASERDVYAYVIQHSDERICLV